MNRCASLKGEGRPLLPEQERAEILANLECVDGVVIFDELTPQKVIAALLPDILVKGSDGREIRSSGAKKWKRQVEKLCGFT